MNNIDILKNKIKGKPATFFTRMTIRLLAQELKLKLSKEEKEELYQYAMTFWIGYKLAMELELTHRQEKIYSENEDEILKNKKIYIACFEENYLKGADREKAYYFITKNWRRKYYGKR